MPSFSVSQPSEHGRLGIFSFDSMRRSIQTPFMFPVASLVTGTTARGGGIWKYILQADPSGNSLLRNHVPILSQVLHFLDYGVSANSIKRWRTTSIRQQYEQDTECKYQGGVFLDSGGFKLMWRDGLNLDAYGIDLSPDHEAISITQLQLDFGADIIASLDYPLPPTLSTVEAQQRMKRSQTNALRVAKYLRKIDTDFKPFFYMPVHGLAPQEMNEYVMHLFDSLKGKHINRESLGIAIGSLVPLRSSNQNLKLIIKIAHAAKKAIPTNLIEKIPVHVFGITGLLLPFLSYIGIDTFDSSTYVKEAINLGYLHPDTRKSHPILEMEELPCNCPICRNANLQEMQKYLVVDTKSRPLPNGHYKSRYFADIALHNLWQDQIMVQETRARIADGNLDEYLIQLVARFPRMKHALEALAENYPQLNQKVSRTLQPIKTLENSSRETPARFQSFTHKPSDFDITANGYRPTQVDGNRLLLIIPCSSEKPYSASNTHQYIAKYLTENFPENLASIHKVSLSGLYGPVPQEYETSPEVLEYNFRLIMENEEQIKLCTDRLCRYLDLHHSSYTHYVAYGTSKAYRTVFERTAKKFPQLQVLPQNLKSRRLTEFFRVNNIEQLVQFIESAFNSDKE